jgi:putative transposase
LKTRYKDDNLADLAEGVRAEVWRRYDLILALSRFAGLETFQMLSREQIEDFLKQEGLAAEKDEASRKRRSRMGTAVSVGSLERYLHAFVSSAGDIRSLIPQTKQQGGKGQKRLDEAVERIIEQVLEKYAQIKERSSTIDQIVSEVVNAIADENRFREKEEALKLPNERTIRRRVKAAGEKRILGRRLSRGEEKKESASQIGPRPSRILERVEIDHTTLDLFVVDEGDGLPIGRPHITACIDKHSAMILGWHIGFNQGGYESIMLCLQHAFLPKPDYRLIYKTEHEYPVYGLCEKLCIDNGLDFKSAALKNALAELGIIREEMPSRTPWFKGSIERYFRSVNQKLLKGKPGYSFGNVVQLGDYDAQKDAVISLSAFLEIFHIFMVDIYPYSWHKGLEALPMQKWQEGWQAFQPDLFEDTMSLRRILLPSAERVLQARGIEWEHNFYWGPELSRLREIQGKEKLRFKYNPDDMNLIYVRDSSSSSGWVQWQSSNPDYTKGLSLAKHRLIRQYINSQKENIDRFSLARAKAQIQGVIEREFVNTKQVRRRSRLKPLLELEKREEVQLRVLRPKDMNPSKEEELPKQEGWSSDYELPMKRRDEHEF